MGQQKYVGGTSMSTPLTASIVNLIDEARLKAGKTPVGFINPALYKAPADIFNDVTGGNMTDPDNPTAGTVVLELDSRLCLDMILFLVWELRSMRSGRRTFCLCRRMGNIVYIELST